MSSERARFRTLSINSLKSFNLFRRVSNVLAGIKSFVRRVSIVHGVSHHNFQQVVEIRERERVTKEKSKDRYFEGKKWDPDEEIRWVGSLRRESLLWECSWDGNGWGKEFFGYFSFAQRRWKMERGKGAKARQLSRETRGEKREENTEIK